MICLLSDCCSVEYREKKTNNYNNETEHCTEIIDNKFLLVDLDKLIQNNVMH